MKPLATALIFLDETSKVYNGFEENSFESIEFIVIGSKSQIIEFKEANTPHIAEVNITFLIKDNLSVFAEIRQQATSKVLFIFPKKTLFNDQFNESIKKLNQDLSDNNLNFLSGFYLNKKQLKYSEEVIHNKNLNIHSLFDELKLFAPHLILMMNINLTKRVNFVIEDSFDTDIFNKTLVINYLSELYTINNHSLPILETNPSGFLSKINPDYEYDKNKLNSMINSKAAVWSKRKLSKLYLHYVIWKWRLPKSPSEYEPSKNRLSSKA